MSNPWVILVFAGLLEIAWAIGLKYTEGFTKLIPSVLTAAAIVGSMYLLARASSVLPIGTAYVVWVGIGSLGASILGVVLFNESMTPMKIVFTVLLLVSIVGIKLSSSH